MAEQLEFEGLGAKVNKNEKFRLTNDIKIHDGVEVHRIQALANFRGVNVGDLGGYVESEDNLASQLGDNSWVFDDAIIYGEGKVEKDSIVRNDSVVANSRITNGSDVSHGSKIENSRLDNTECQFSETFYANVKDSSLLHEAKVKNSRVVNSSVENYSEVYNSKMEDSKLVNDAKISKGANITNVILNDEKLEGQTVRDYDTADALNLSDEDLAELENLANSMDIPF